MSVVVLEGTPHAHEMWKWEHFEDEVNPTTGERGKRSRVFKAFPMAMYRCLKGGTVPEFECLTVASESERDNYASMGYVDNQPDALHRYERDKTELAILAANRAYNDQNMSDAAKAEVAAVESQSSTHLAEIPEQKRRGRPRKTEQ